MSTGRPWADGVEHEIRVCAVTGEETIHGLYIVNIERRRDWACMDCKAGRHGSRAYRLHSPQAAPQRTGGLCPGCNLELPLTGLCDACD